MKRTDFTLLPLVAVLVATATWSISSNARAITQDEMPGESESLAAESCRARVAPDFVPVSDGEIVVAVSLPQEIGAVTAVYSEEGSGINIVDFSADEADNGELVTRLDVAQAEAGTWWLEFEGERAKCSALLTIGEAKLGG